MSQARLAALCLAGALAACTTSDRAPGPRGGLEVRVSPLRLPGVGIACYDIEVAGLTDRVWSRGEPLLTRLGAVQTDAPDPLFAPTTPFDGGAVCSDDYGNAGGGDIVYVGPCDASPEADSDGDEDNGVQNVVTVWVDGLYDAALSGDIGGWQDPCPSGCALQIDCDANADSLAAFDLTVMRQANQGFFDVAVGFDDIFCSAKLDTCYANDTEALDDDERIMLLFGDDDVRDWTAVFGFACTAGPGAETTLAYGDITVACAGGVTFTIDPTLPGGSNHVATAGASALHYGIYRGDEALACDDPETPLVEGCAKRYWNLAFDLVDLASLSGCELTLAATAFDGDAGFVDGLPAGLGKAYPYIVVDGALGLACQHDDVDAGGAVGVVYRGDLEGLTAPEPVCDQYDGAAVADTCAAGACTCAPGMTLDPSGERCTLDGTAEPIVNPDQLAVCASATHPAYAMFGAHFHASFTPGTDEGGGCTDEEACVEVREEPWLGYLGEVGIWACAGGTGAAGSGPTGTWIGFSRCIDIAVAGDYLVGLAGDNRVLLRVDGAPVYQSTRDDYNFKSWNVFKLHLDAGPHVIELFGRNNGSLAAFGAEIAGPFEVGSIDTPTAMAAADYAGHIVFSTRDLRGGGAFFDTSLYASQPIGTTCPYGFALDLCGAAPICRGHYETACDAGGACDPANHTSPLDCSCDHLLCAPGEACLAGELASGCAPIPTAVSTPDELGCARDVGAGGGDLVEVDGKVFFPATDRLSFAEPTHGEELWVSDGTETGTRLVKDIALGEQSSSPNELTAFAGQLYFVADDGVYGGELWRSDGTEGGTVMVADLVPGEDGSYPESLTVVGASLYFSTYDPDSGRPRLWKVDGAGGVALVAELVDADSLQELTAFGARLVFTDANERLWTSDGTEAGTEPLLTGGGDTVRAKRLTVAGGLLYFSGTTEADSDWEPWLSDGTAAGTRPIADLVAAGSSDPESFEWLAGSVYFIAQTEDGRVAVWRTDGTPSGTVMVAAFDGLDASLVPMGGALYFVAYDDAYGWELWRSDGTPGGTTLVRDIEPGPDDAGPEWLTVVGATLYFAASDAAHGEELWKSDGTEAGTVLVEDIFLLEAGQGSEPVGLLAVGSRLWLWAQDDLTGQEVWTSDGTATGTSRLANINRQQQGVDPEQLTALGDTLFYVGADCEHGEELRRRDGTVDALVRDIIPGSSDPDIEELTVVGTRLFFQADDDLHGEELWTSDGTEAGTRLVKDIAVGPESSSPQGFAALGDTLFFQATDEDGDELWRSDGTEAGTVRVLDIASGPDGSHPDELTVAGATLYFVANDETHGRELWKSDGTAAGTVLVRDIVPGPGGSFVQDVTAVGDRVFFEATASGSGSELWVSDGTEAGTTLVADIMPGPIGSGPYGLVAWGSRVCFAADDDDHGTELWLSDGTAAGTFLVADLEPGTGSASPYWFTPSGSLVFFVAQYDGREELWVTDGTPAGTRMPRPPTDAGSEPTALVAAPGGAFFVPYDPAYGYEPWRSNGTAWGTQLLVDVAPGEPGSYADHLTVIGDTLYFAADDGFHGWQLFEVDIGP